MSSTIPATAAPKADLDKHGVTEVDLDKLRHMVGMGRHIRRGSWGYRNHYAASGDATPAMLRLLAAGFVVQGGEYGESHFYHATAAGCAAIGMSKAATKRALS